MKKFSCIAIAFTMLGFVWAGSSSHGEDTDKLTIKVIMKEAFKGPLVKKVGKGDASAEEKKQLLNFAKAMQGMTAPKGDAESWKEKNAALVEAAQAAVDGKENASALLMKATNCAACHKQHKPK